MQELERRVVRAVPFACKRARQELVRLPRASMRRSRTARGGLAPHLAAPYAAANMMDARAARISPTHARNFKRGRRRAAAARPERATASCYSGATQAGSQRTSGTAGVLAGLRRAARAQRTMFGPGSMKLAICMSSADISPSSGSTTALRRSNRATSAPMAPKARERESAMSSRCCGYRLSSRLALQLSPTRSSTKHFVLTHRQKDLKLLQNS